MYSQFSYSDSVLNQIFFSHAQRDIENIAQQAVAQLRWSLIIFKSIDQRSSSSCLLQDEEPLINKTEYKKIASESGVCSFLCFYLMLDYLHIRIYMFYFSTLR